MQTQGDNRNDESVFRFDTALTIISIAAASLIAWAFSLIPEEQSIKVLTGIIAGISTAVYLITISNTGKSRSATVIKATSWVALIVSVLVLLPMSIWCHTPSYFIITMSLIVLIFVTTIMGVARSHQ